MDPEKTDRPSFFVAHKFPSTTEPSGEANAAPSGRRHVFTRIVLPLILFMLIIGGIAWVTQYLPSWRERPPTLQVNQGKGPAPKLIVFPDPVTIWERDEKGQPTDYAKEFERNAEGQADFLFQNTTPAIAELGLTKAGCDCSKAEIFISSQQWMSPPTLDQLRQDARLLAMSASDATGIEIPPNAYGFVRLSWKGRKQEGERLNLTLDMWMQPKGISSMRALEKLFTPTILVPPIQFVPDKQPLGVIADLPAKTEFWCWSSTRAVPEFKVSERDADPRFVYQLRTLDPKERQALEEKLRGQKINSRLQSAFHLSVTVHGQKDGRQLDQGPFQRYVPLMLDGFTLEPQQSPLIYGTVRGNVEIPGLDNSGKINLKNFPVNLGITHKVTLFSPTDVELAPEGQYPPYLEYQLTRVAGEPNARRIRWVLEVRVPPAGLPGPLPEDSVIILRTGGKTPRLIRIPLTGNAVQG